MQFCEKVINTLRSIPRDQNSAGAQTHSTAVAVTGITEGQSEPQHHINGNAPQIPIHSTLPLTPSLQLTPSTFQPPKLLTNIVANPLVDGSKTPPLSPIFKFDPIILQNCPQRHVSSSVLTSASGMKGPRSSSNGSSHN